MWTGTHTSLCGARVCEIEAIGGTGAEVNKGAFSPPPGQPKCIGMLLATPAPHQAAFNVCVKSSQGGAAAAWRGSSGDPRCLELLFRPGEIPPQ